jgi:uncharacterized protein (DUF362 family)
MRKKPFSSLAPMNRREFLKWKLSAGLASVAGLGLFRPASLFASQHPDIAIAGGDGSAAARAAVELLGGMSRFVKPGQKVVVKPNMSFDQGPEKATTTHPAVVQSVAAMCSEAGAERVMVLDNPLRSAEMCIENSGIKMVGDRVARCTVEGPQSSDRFRTVKVEGAKEFTEAEVLKEVLDADVIIAVPVAKHHSSTGVSLSMKGQMGLINNRSVMHWRYDLDESIVDLCTMLRADLSVIDVTRALTTNGPGGPGDVVRPGKVVASADMVAADAQAVTMVRWYGRSLAPSQVRHIKLAHERGFGSMDIESMRVQEIAV